MHGLAISSYRQVAGQLLRLLQEAYPAGYSLPAQRGLPLVADITSTVRLPMLTVSIGGLVIITWPDGLEYEKWRKNMAPGAVKQEKETRYELHKQAEHKENQLLGVEVGDGCGELWWLRRLEWASSK